MDILLRVIFLEFCFFFVVSGGITSFVGIFFEQFLDFVGSWSEVVTVWAVRTQCIYCIFFLRNMKNMKMIL